ncbi:hypothetical protein [Escherichia coli]|uniref:Uncharacterized protein n=1 Tax=Escherichia phage 18-1-2 TaxID=2883041 RepID=A0A8K1QNR4_9CAUD|nr:hypothetical protein [Escherichia coli]UDW09936.1 hypothetical protein [Escherichia phage 18-1-2]UJQ87325.1 hypothetical protein [Escherichia phage 24-2-1]UJQ87602.1 hypothetical protein [Escherichia phage 19-1-2]UOX40201.1 hypothetical protein [Escherichia phage vB_EcoM_TH18]
MKAKNIILFSSLLFSPLAISTTNTLSLEAEYRDGDSKVCIYSDGHRTEAVVKEGAGSCPSKRTFH